MDPDLPPKLVFHQRSEFLAITLELYCVFVWEVEDTETLKAHGGLGEDLGSPSLSRSSVGLCHFLYRYRFRHDPQILPLFKN